MSEHKVEVKFDEKFLARPYGIICSCGFRGAALDEQEARRIAEHHKQNSPSTAN